MDNPTTCLNKLLLKRDDLDSAPEDIKCFIYARSKWFEDCAEFVLQETRSGKCFKGKLSRDEIEESATDLEIPFEEFFAEVRTALTANLSAPGFVYEIAEEMLKVTKTQEFDIQYVEVKLREVRNNFDILDTAIALVNGEQKACSQRVETEVRNEHNFEELKEAFKHALDEKNKIEKKILKKCALLLNEKKAKIAELQEKLAQRNGGTIDSELEDDEEIEAAQVLPETVQQNKNKRNKLATKSTNKDADEEEDEEDFTAATQQLTQPDEDTPTEPLPKRSRTQLRILDDTTDDLSLPDDSS